MEKFQNLFQKWQYSHKCLSIYFKRTLQFFNNGLIESWCIVQIFFFFFYTILYFLQLSLNYSRVKINFMGLSQRQYMVRLARYSTISLLLLTPYLRRCLDCKFIHSVGHFEVLCPLWLQEHSLSRKLRTERLQVVFCPFFSTQISLLPTHGAETFLRN